MSGDENVLPDVLLRPAFALDDKVQPLLSRPPTQVQVTCKKEESCGTLIMISYPLPCFSKQGSGRAGHSAGGNCWYSNCPAVHLIG